MDIRIKGAICVFIYNLIGTLAVCSLSHDAPLHGDWVSPTLFFTFPISFLSFVNQFVYIQPIWSTLTIQFVMLAITLFITDLILRNFSPAYIEKRKARLEKKEIEYIKKSGGLITSEQINVYLNYPKDINLFKQEASIEEKQVLSIEQWFTIDNLAKEVLLIKKGEISTSTKNSIEKRIAEKLNDQEAMDLLFMVE